MTTILIANQPDQIRNILPWARHIAASRGGQLAVILPQRRKRETRLVSLPAIAEDDESELVTAARIAARGSLPPSDGDAADYSANRNDGSLPDQDAESLTSSDADAVIQPADSTLNLPVATDIWLFQLLGEDWSTKLSVHLAELQPSLAVVPAPAFSKEQRQQDDWQTVLLANLDCETILIRDDAVSFEEQIRVAVFLSDGSDNEASLKCGAQLVSTFDGTATAVYVEPNIGDLASPVGMRRCESLLRGTLSTAELACFSPKVVVASRPSEAIGQLDVTDFDLLLLGTADLREMRKFLSNRSVSQATSSIPAVAVVRRGPSFSNRLRNKLDGCIRSFVPQLAREERIGLVSRIQSSSQWDFDFVLLISLATLIACLGLAENSGAVIVGAMLVAPLMTPIAGIGLGVAHANSFLTKVAFRTAMRGFATAILIGVVFGLCVQGAAAMGWLAPLNSPLHATENGPHVGSFFPEQMESRMRPQFYDLLIALASGVAAAYAMGRPNLFSALPGVAIAAALVPPLATSGIAFSHGDLIKGGGALLLFVTNMVTIILGTSLVFRAVGIRSQKEGPSAARWPRYTLLLLLVLSILITVIIEVRN